MGVDVVDRLRGEARHRQGVFHRGPKTVALGVRNRDVVPIGGLGPAGDFAVNFGAAPRDFVLGFEHEHDATARAHKTITRDVERPRREVRIGLQRQRAHAGKRQDRIHVSILGPNDEHAFLTAEHEIVVSKTQGVRRRGAGRRKPAGRALDLEMSGEVEIHRARDRRDDAEG